MKCILINLNGVFTMMKRNAIVRTLIASAVLAVVASAQAGTLSTATVGGTVFATENFGTGTSATTAIVPGAVTYTVGTTAGIVINAGGKIYYTVRLAGGTFAAAPTGALTGSVLAVGGVGNGAVTGPALSADKTTATFTITFTAAATLGVGSTLIYTPSAADVVGVNTTLATAGGAVTASTSLSAITPPAVPVGTGTAQPADIDAPIATGAIAVASKAINGAVSSLAGANPLAGSKVQIDLTATPPASTYVTTTAAGVTAAAAAAALGQITFTDGTTVANLLNGTTPYNTAVPQAAGSLAITVTPGTGQSFPVGSKVFVDVTSAACAAPLAGTAISAALTATTAAATVSLTVPQASLLASTGKYFVCVNSPSIGNTASPVTPTITASLNPTVATYVPTTTNGIGYAFGYNGSQVDVRSYIPSATTGYASFVRVINTGSVSSVINIAPISAAGVVGSSGSLGTLAPNAVTTFTSTQVEAALTAAGNAALLSTDRPRLRITAPTNGLSVQSFFLNPNGVFSTMHGAD